MVHPRNEIDKVYVARVKGIANKDVLRPLTRGVVIDGKKTKPAVYEILKVDPVKNRSVVQLTIHERRNHQVKKMFEAVGLLVDKLSRTQFGNLDLTDLRPGEARRLNKKEISRLHTLAVSKKKSWNDFWYGWFASTNASFLPSFPLPAAIGQPARPTWFKPWRSMEAKVFWWV